MGFSLWLHENLDLPFAMLSWNEIEIFYDIVCQNIYILHMCPICVSLPTWLIIEFESYVRREIPSKD